MLYIRRPQKSVFSPILRHALLISICLLVISPVLTAILGSVRTTGEFLTTPFGLPQSGIHWENYTGILESQDFWVSLRNSALITFGVTVLNVAFACMLAFVFSRMRFAGRDILYNILAVGLLIPIVAAILPIFIQIRQFGLINSLWGVILPLVAFGLPSSVAILRAHFVQIPIELEEASYLDGCSHFRFFIHILLPLSRPAITTVAVLQMIIGWNEYLVPLLVLNDTKAWPLTLGLQQFQGEHGTDWASLMAYVTLLIVPALAFYFVAQRYIVTGLTGGELKG
jgi:raffinose/stachyose/melibiose transport system permease protein